MAVAPDISGPDQARKTGKSLGQPRSSGIIDDLPIPRGTIVVVIVPSADSSIMTSRELPRDGLVDMFGVEGR